MLKEVLQEKIIPFMPLLFGPQNLLRLLVVIEIAHTSVLTIGLLPLTTSLDASDVNPEHWRERFEGRIEQFLSWEVYFATCHTEQWT